ncbi:Zinc finger protein-likeush [Orchesella cincta]|uniref:Zinc finger protein-likeush n=1 Tax=Orchesella cincta TaxID=48709 RepID=A0A1D2NAH7_ORCCI|nr:Zinc finger protein-likeush [Orchesella cincta]
MRAMYVCEPCNIKFSSARTLEAHQTYYCSFRKDLGKHKRHAVETVPVPNLSLAKSSNLENR